MSDEGGANGAKASFLCPESDQPWSFSNFDNSGSDHQNIVVLGSKPNSPIVGLKIDGDQEKTEGKINGSSSSKGKGEASDDHEMHILTERERRKKMRNMFSNLHELIPHLPSKADKSTIVDEAVTYIKSLQQTLQNLQQQKLERMQVQASSSSSLFPPVLRTPQSQAINNSRESFLATAPMSPTLMPMPRLSNSFQAWSTDNAMLNVSGEHAHISISTVKKPGTLANIFYIMEKYKLEVLLCTVSSDYFRSMYMIHARMPKGLEL
ncbi:uncharacterized protein A4U43_C02F7430 [Asparagus officinalis]|uniref:BHLH domain-containing protein n=1 Tax=Asparagus officinalis TaxID=4686 RepID=A0A5P1FLP7_ASPOF|nr:uncharacterized protein A4U43_C02F7430 [Asparagus officinalis]